MIAFWAAVLPWVGFLSTLSWSALLIWVGWVAFDDGDLKFSAITGTLGAILLFVSWHMAPFTFSVSLL